ncbi:hypothetical protein STEG23_037414 [Scotinomys teguina]
MAKTVFPLQHKRTIISEHSSSASAYDSSSVCFSKDNEWGWTLERPTLIESGLCKVLKCEVRDFPRREELLSCLLASALIPMEPEEAGDECAWRPVLSQGKTCFDNAVSLTFHYVCCGHHSVHELRIWEVRKVTVKAPEELVQEQLNAQHTEESTSPWNSPACVIKKKSASLLTFWHLSTTANVTIELVPPHVAEGENVLFLVHNLPKNFIAFAWLKGPTDLAQGIAWYNLDNNLHGPGVVYSGRETVYRNGSLLIQNLTQEDTGSYTIQIYNRRAKLLSKPSVYLHVTAFLWKCGRLTTSALSSIESVPPIVAEGKSVLLLIHNPPENIEGFMWFKGMAVLKNLLVVQYILERRSIIWGPAYGGRETVYNDGSLLIQGVTPKDYGLYSLRILRTDKRSEEAQVQLQVDTSLSLFCNPLTSSQFIIQLEPRYPDEGEDVMFQVYNLPEDMQAFSWHKSKYRTEVIKIVEYSRAMNSSSWGPAHRGRGMVYNNGSLMLHDVTEKDEGIYTLSVLRKDVKIEKASVEFYVKKYVSQPFVQISDTRVAGRRSVIFTCISRDTDVSIRWIFNNKNLELTERMTLSPTKCGLRIDPVGFQDAGDYKFECTFALMSTHVFLRWVQAGSVSEEASFRAVVTLGLMGDITLSAEYVA